jgi:hypothetical protein
MSLFVRMKIRVVGFLTLIVVLSMSCRKEKFEERIVGSWHRVTENNDFELMEFDHNDSVKIYQREFSPEVNCSSIRTAPGNPGAAVFVFAGAYALANRKGKTYLTMVYDGFNWFGTISPQIIEYRVRKIRNGKLVLDVDGNYEREYTSCD